MADKNGRLVKAGARSRAAARAFGPRELAPGAMIEVGTFGGTTARRRVLGRAEYRRLQEELREIREYQQRLEAAEWEAKR